ncbi:MAG: hypothetical protein ACHREM_08160 [Polyangiales bacterium]
MSLDLNARPSDPYERRAAIISFGSKERGDRAVQFIKHEYADAPLLETCRRFVFTDFLDTPRSDIPAIRRVWFFPWIETQYELGEALSHALLANYKAVIDSCRRALELTVVGTYFQQAHVPEEQAKRWMKSEQDTPMFSRALGVLLKTSRFSALDAKANWSTATKQFYWDLCDVVHVRGTRHGFRALQPSHLHLDDVSMREFTAERLKETLDTIVRTCRHIAGIVAAENPVLLVGMDMAQKFGMNPPLSGFFDEAQAERLKQLILPEFAAVFERFRAEDDEVRSVVSWFEGLPDITDEGSAEQLREFEAEWETVAPGVRQRRM